jgi:HD-GYP domain-containing protein (c-di-GMP phosphodiesterase class II)/ABC-type amino acid transport substrate-binding protein
MLNKTISIRLNLLAYFILVVSLVAGTLIAVEYYYSNKLAHSAAQDSFRLVAKNLSTYINEQTDQHDQALTLLGAEAQLINEDISAEHPLARSMMTTLMKKSPGIFATYIGRNNDDFYQIINVESDPLVRIEYRLDDDIRWLEIRISGEGEGRKSVVRQLDQALNIVKTEESQTTYRPTIRPWYLQAGFSDTTVQTEPYWFNEINGSGITLAQKLTHSDGVIAVDLTMNSYSDFLRSQLPENIQEVMLFDRHGKKYASSRKIVTTERKALDFSATQPISLTEQERAFLAANPQITITNETDWPPYDFAEHGEPTGYSIDLIKLIAAKTGINFKFINGLSWSQLITLFKQGKIDVLQSAYFEQERTQFGIYTEPMYGIKNQLIVPSSSEINTLNDLEGKKVAIVEGWSTVDFLKKNHPGIEVVTYPTPIETYVAVSFGEAEATIDTELAMAYYAKMLNLSNLSAASWVSDFDGGQPRGLHMLVQKDKQILREILDKALESITEEERQLINRRWLRTDQEALGEDSIPTQMLLNAILETDDLAEFSKANTNGTPDSYFGFSTLFDEENNNAHIGIIATVDRMVGPYMEQVRISLYAATVVLLFAFMLVMWVTSRILRPIHALMHENDKVGQRRFSEVKLIESRITEFSQLSQSLIDMSDSIRQYEKSQEELMEALIQLIADAIDAKSPYTGGHCIRVPTIAIQLAEEAAKESTGPFADFRFDDEDAVREFRIGAWLHDCGKVITPEHVVDKATKLETIYNRIHEIRTRFEVLWRDAEITALKKRLDGEEPQQVEAWLNNEQQRLQDDYAFLAECNIGGEFMSDEMQERIRALADQRWQRHFSKLIGLSQDEEKRLVEDDLNEQLPIEEKLLDDKPEHVIPRVDFDHEAYEAQGFKVPVPDNLFNKGEVYNLCIKRGTLTEEERYKINEHVIMTIRMLEQLPLPENLSQVPEYAGTHHETLIGTGYPRKRTKDELSIPARIMALADVFEALTATDRPYKKGKKITEAMKILSFMVKDQHIDGDVFELFLRSGIYLDYCEKFLEPEQIDEINIEDYL